MRGQKYLIIAFAILIFSTCTRIARLSIPEKFYFDEVYHSYTAKLYLHNERKAYDPWSKSDPNMGIEWTHPPLAKLAMTSGMAIFGEDSFGWRISSVVFGTIAVGLTGVLAYFLLGSASIAVVAMALLSLETLSFVQYRIGMNDVYFICFMLLVWLSHWRWRTAPRGGRHWLWITGLGLGLALASKWTTLYLFMFIGIDFVWVWLRKKREVRFADWAHALAALALLPIVLYLAAYGHYFSLGYSFADFVKLQREMWMYHTRLAATHSYQSKPWQWIFNLRPVWMAVDYSDPGKIGNIYNLGNSVILLGGLWAALMAGISVLKRRNKKAKVARGLSYALIAYLILWVPWAFSPRIMLFYHYAPAIPLLCILIAWWLDQNRKNFKVMFLAAALGWFVLFYPHATLVSVPKGFANTLYFLLPGWR